MKVDRTVIRHPKWEAAFRQRNPERAFEHRGVWFQASGNSEGRKHYLVNHGEGDLGKLSGSAARPDTVRSWIDAHLAPSDTNTKASDL